MSVAAVPVALSAFATVYAVGMWRLRERTGGWARRPAGAFAAGWLLLAVALLPPVETLAARSFAAHMTQHLLVGVLAPLFVVLGAPLRIAHWAAPRKLDALRRRLGGALARLRRARGGRVGLAAVALHATAFWVWHAPHLYRAAARSELLHGSEHMILFVTGAFFWWVVAGTRWRSRPALGIGLVFLAALQGGAMAALITLAPRPLYGSGPGALVDQQLGGAIMWVPGGAVYLLAASIQFVRWLQSGPQDVRVPSQRATSSSVPRPMTTATAPSGTGPR